MLNLLLIEYKGGEYFERDFALAGNTQTKTKIINFKTF